MINVTKTFLPNFEIYTATLKRAWDKAWITNNGELVLELEAKLKDYLFVNNLLFTNNGTVPLQMALKAMHITGEVITTPFSYVATTNAILWEGAKPVFVDIDEKTFCIDAQKIEAAITKDTQAILATHVYGIPCDVVTIEAIAKKHKLRFSEKDLPVEKLNNKITFYGKIPADQLAQYLQKFDIIVAPNRAGILGKGSFDGFPVGCCVEASLAGCVIVTTDPTNENIWYKNGDEIIIVQACKNSIVEQLKLLIENPEKISLIGKAGMNRTKTLYSKENQLDRRVHIIETCLKNLN